jgi:hypothetical protein
MGQRGYRSDTLANLRHGGLNASAVGHIRLNSERFAASVANFLCNRRAGFNMA